MAGKPEKYADDDERVICNMNVEGMPWHDRQARRPKHRLGSALRGEPMTRSETRRYIWNSVLAALLIVLVFSVTWVLFTLFLTQVWAR